MTSDRLTPRRLVRRVGPEARARQTLEAPSPEVVGRVAARLRDRLTAAGIVEGPELAGLGDHLAASLPLEPAQRDVLARVLGAPPALALRWVQDSIGLLRAGAASLEDPEQRLALTARLDVMAWAWDELPERWTPGSEQALLRRWAAAVE